DFESFVITVNNMAPIAAFGNSGPSNEGSRGTVTFSNPFDPSPADTAEGFTYSFDFDNDGTFEVTDSPSASVEIPAAYFADGPGSRVVRGRIADKDGGYNDYTATISILNVPPTAAVTGPKIGRAHV